MNFVSILVYLYNKLPATCENHNPIVFSLIGVSGIILIKGSAFKESVNKDYLRCILRMLAILKPVYIPPADVPALTMVLSKSEAPEYFNMSANL